MHFSNNFASLARFSMMAHHPNIYVVLTNELSATGGDCPGVVVAGAYLSAENAGRKKEGLAQKYKSVENTVEVEAIGRMGLQGYRIKQKDGFSFAVWVDVVAVEDARVVVRCEQ